MSSDDMREARGGPLDGMRVPCRWPAGLLLVDKAGQRAMVYDLTGGELVSRGEVLELDAGRAIGAAVKDRFDVLAYDDETMGGWDA